MRVSGGVSRRSWNGMRRAQQAADEKRKQRRKHPKRKLSIVLRKVHRVPAHFVWGRCCWLVGSVTVSLFVSFVCAVFASRFFRLTVAPDTMLCTTASNTSSSLLFVVYFQFETFVPLMAWSRVAHVCAAAKKVRVCWVSVTRQNLFPVLQWNECLDSFFRKSRKLINAQTTFAFSDCA